MQVETINFNPTKLGAIFTYLVSLCYVCVYNHVSLQKTYNPNDLTPLFGDSKNNNNSTVDYIPSEMSDNVGKL